MGAQRDSEGVIEELGWGHKVRRVRVARALVQASGRIVPVRVANFGKREIKIKARTAIAKLEPTETIVEENINPAKGTMDSAIQLPEHLRELYEETLKDLPGEQEANARIDHHVGEVEKLKEKVRIVAKVDSSVVKRSKAWYRRDRRRKQKEREKGILAENLPVTPRENLHHTPPRAEQKSSSSEESPDPGLWGELPFRYKSTPELRRVLRVTQGEEKKRHKAIIPFVAPRVRANSKSAAVVFREVGASAPHFPILHQKWTIASPWAASSAATDSAGRIEWKRGDCGSLRESTSGSEAQSELLPEAEKKESSPAT
ncbi:hypothetical protein DMENIID0001_111570 [Sergentomyia squamirostris]